MPKLPIDAAPPSEAAGPGLAGSQDYAALPPGARERLARLRAGDEAIKRELRASESRLAGMRRIVDAEVTPGGVARGYAEGVVAEIDRKNAETLHATPAALRPAMKADLDAARDDLGARAAEAEATGRAVQRRMALRGVLDANAALARLDVRALGGATQRTVGLVDSLDLPAETQDAIKAHMRTVLGNAALDGLLDDPADAQAALAAGHFDEYLDAQGKAERSAEIAELLKRQQIRAAAQGILALSLQAKAGELDEAALDAAVAAGRIGTVDAARLRSLDENALAEAEAHRAGMARVAAADGPLDPDSAVDRAAVDAYWDTVKDGFAFDDPAQAREAELFFVQWKKVLPSLLRRKYEGMLLSDDPALTVAGAQAITAFDKSSDSLTRDVDPDRVRLARAVAGYAELGLAPGEAVARAREEIGQDELAPEKVPGPFGGAAAPSRAEAESLPGVDVGVGATAAVDRDRSNRVFGTAKRFIAFLRELQALPADEVADHARAVGLAGNLGQIALDILDAANREGDTREAQLQAIRRDIDQLPNVDARTKRRLNDLLTVARGILDEPKKLLRVLAINRDLFRGQARLANVGPDAVETERFADFQRQTGLIARPVMATLTPQQGDPDDLGAVTTRDLGPADDVDMSLDARIRRLRRRIAFFRPGSDTPFLTLPESAARAIMTRPEKAAERLDFIAKWRSGELAGEELIAAARRVFIGDQESSLVVGGDAILRASMDAFLDAKDRIEAGEDADGVLAALMPSLIPQAYQDPAAAADLVLDMLPIIGGIHAMHYAAQDIKELRRATAAGDDAAVLKARVSLVLGALGLIPVVGPLLRNVKPVFFNTLRNRRVSRFLRSAPGIKRLHGGFVFPRRFAENVESVGRADAATVFGAAYRDLTPRQRRLARGLISNIKGAAAHHELALLAKNGRLTLKQLRESRIVSVERRNTNIATGNIEVVELGDRIFDEYTEEGYKLLFNTFLVPRRGRGGTLFEFKAGNARGSAPQQEKTILIERIAENGELIETVASAKQLAAAAEAVKLARVSYKDIPEDWIAEQTRRLFEKHVGDKEIKLTKKQVDQLVEAARQWHRQVRHEKSETINLGQILMVLSMEAQAFALANSRHEEESSVLGAGIA